MWVYGNEKLVGLDHVIAARHVEYICRGVLFILVKNDVEYMRVVLLTLVKLDLKYTSSVGGIVVSPQKRSRYIYP